ncbi:putative methyltransferase PMT11 [Abeliophyllum distichum]|uniref:Methyltransferase n=1 Tax=Abeliophyllum distichum TaxID=126358 RepID=A0ABD1UMZ0_9LAMI
MCPESMGEYIPCLDNNEAIKKLNSTQKGELFERHCPEKGKELNCLIPTPKGYRTPIHWPKSRDEMVYEIAFGRHTRVALDIGCVVTTLSIAPKDVHENQIQFALERGVPAVVAVFATRRFLYPSQAFDLIHCSRCRINWTRDDGILLLEVNRILRAGGYFAWVAQPVYEHETLLEEQWEEMVNLASVSVGHLLRRRGMLQYGRSP